MPMALQSLCSQLWERGGRQMSLEFSLECSLTLWWRHFWWQTVPSSCRSDGERSVADRGKPCQWYSQCRGRWWTQAVQTCDATKQKLAAENATNDTTLSLFATRYSITSAELQQVESSDLPST